MEPRSSSQQAFENIFDRHSGDIAAYLRRRVPREVADDVLSETFLVAWRRFAEMPPLPLPWLYGIAHRTLANHLRGRRRRAALVDRLKVLESTPRLHGPTESETSDVLGALRRLKPADQEVLTLIAWEGLTISEAADVLGCSKGAFRVRLHRARSRMERQLSRDRGFGATRTVMKEAR